MLSSVHTLFLSVLFFFVLGIMGKDITSDKDHLITSEFFGTVCARGG